VALLIFQHIRLELQDVYCPVLWPKTDFKCVYFSSILIFIHLLNPQWVLATLRSQLKLAVENLSGIHLAAKT